MAWSLLASLLALGTSEGGGAGGVSVELCRLAVAVRLRHGGDPLELDRLFLVMRENEAEPFEDEQ
jgi:hypothetical protein